VFYGRSFQSAPLKGTVPRKVSEIVTLNDRFGPNQGSPTVIYEQGDTDVKLVSPSSRILLKHGIKIRCVVRRSIIASSACCPCTPGVSSVDHQRVAYRCHQLITSYGFGTTL
jgi:hypothetical protein